MRQRLKETADFAQRFEALCARADELGIRLDIRQFSTNRLVAVDIHNNSMSYEVVDNDLFQAVPHRVTGNSPDQFPPGLEYSLLVPESELA